MAAIDPGNFKRPPHAIVEELLSLKVEGMHGDTFDFMELMRRFIHPLQAREEYSSGRDVGAEDAALSDVEQEQLTQATRFRRLIEGVGNGSIGADTLAADDTKAIVADGVNHVLPAIAADVTEDLSAGVARHVLFMAKRLEAGETLPPAAVLMIPMLRQSAPKECADLEDDADFLRAFAAYERRQVPKEDQEGALFRQSVGLLCELCDSLGVPVSAPAHRLGPSAEIE